jgi:hypothetical protein
LFIKEFVLLILLLIGLSRKREVKKTGNTTSGLAVRPYQDVLFVFWAEKRIEVASTTDSCPELWL